MSGEKTEEPTEKKLEDARKKGESSKSTDVNAAFGLLAFTCCLAGAASVSSEHLLKLFAIVYERGIAVQTNHELSSLAFDMAKEGILLVLPFIVLSIIVGIVVSFAQVGIKISFEPLSPKFDKLNPASGIKKIVSVRSLVDFIKVIFKAALLGSVVYVIGSGLVPLLVGASLQTPYGIIEVGWAALLKLCGASVIVFMIIGPADWAIQKWLFLRDQKMSKDEVKREYKEMEGDPQLKGQRKQLAHEIANGDPKATVPQASVVVMNPTHYAVALRYVPGETPLPIVVAKGVDDAAMRIRAIAESHRVPVVVNPPLARGLYKVPVDEAVPEALFDAVAAVLRWVRMIGQISQEVTGAARILKPNEKSSPGGDAP